MVDNPTIVFKKLNKVVVENRRKPSPGQGELLIETRCSLISTGTESTILTGEYPKDSFWEKYYGKFPIVPGYSNIGVVLEAGEGVDSAWVGRRVASYAKHSAYVTEPVESVVEIEQKISDEEAGFFTIAEIVMNGIRRGRVQWGETVAVYGLGLLGQLAVQFCALSGARRIIGIDTAQSRLNLLPHRPSIIPLNPKSNDLLSEVKRVTRGRMVDVVFEITGNQNLIPQEFVLLKIQGRFVVLGSPRGATSFDFHDLCNNPSFTIIGAHNGSHPEHETPYNPWTKSRHVELFFDLVADKQIDVKTLITHREPFSKAPEIYKMLMKDRSKAMGVIFKWK
jgi:2-desacetyl-2-hydroxyethyl bacteriochlorophyllide A dehydrogenase